MPLAKWWGVLLRYRNQKNGQRRSKWKFRWTRQGKELSNSQPALSPAIAQRLKKSECIVRWWGSKFGGMRIPQLPNSKRLQLASACWHVTIEHSMGILELVRATLHGSALALVRPMYEAYIRGMWLMYAATDEDIDRAGRDKFPFNPVIVTALEKSPHFPSNPFSDVKDQSWKRLCSYTHTGYQQIGARLTSQGLNCNFQDSEILEALLWADMIALAAAAAIAIEAQNDPLAQEVLRKMKSVPKQ